MTDLDPSYRIVLHNYTVRSGGLNNKHLPVPLSHSFPLTATDSSLGANQMIVKWVRSIHYQMQVVKWSFYGPFGHNTATGEGVNSLEMDLKESDINIWP